jgi:hypothetical protein
MVTLEAMIGAADGRLVRTARSVPASESLALGALVAEELLERGGRELLPAERPAVRS